MTKKDRDELVQQAAEKRAANPDYLPTVAELKAIDELLVEQARERLLQEAASGEHKPSVGKTTDGSAPEKSIDEVMAYFTAKNK